MSLKLGTQDISGISQNTKYNAHHLLDFKWTDCIMNDVSWLRADTFSWQSGDVYTSAYNHLVQDLQGTTAETETIGNYTVTYYRATDGHKIVLADQETTVANIYSETGIAWYYILDTINTQFKLPRTKFGFEGLRTNVGNNIEAGLPNITGTLSKYVGYGNGSGSLYATSGAEALGAGGSSYGTSVINLDASLSSSIYGGSSTVQPPATQMYLYFYVGDFSQTAIEQTAGLNGELFNGKADADLSNTTPAISFATAMDTAGIRTVVETYQNGTSWYRVYSDGWCEQGGATTVGAAAPISVTLLKQYTNNLYSVQITINGTASDANSNNYPYQALAKTTSTFKICNYGSGAGANNYYQWQSCGYIS